MATPRDLPRGGREDRGRGRGEVWSAWNGREPIYIFFFAFIFGRGFNAGALQLLAWLEGDDDSWDPTHASLLLLWREIGTCFLSSSFEQNGHHSSNHIIILPM
jgi:hypothetical protein